METTRRKALYIFLSSILGILLFTMFHRALFVIYEIIGSFYPAVYWLHLPFPTLGIIDFSTFLLALFFGGWYGVWIGLNWYKLIYEERGVKSWFHGFIPHHFRNRKHKQKSDDSDSDLDFINSIAAKTSKTKTMPKRIVVTSETAPVVRNQVFRSFRTRQTSTPWDNEDAQLEPKAVKKVSRKRVVKKTVRKTVVKKKVTE